MSTHENRPNIHSERGEVDGELVGCFATLAAVILVVGGGITTLSIHGGSHPESSTNPTKVSEYMTAAESCQQPSQAVPNHLTMPVTKDNRSDMIYPCHYFNDIKLPANKKLALGEVTSETFDRNISDAQIEGHLGGLVILAVGGVSGELKGNAHSDVVRERLYLVNIKDTDGNYVFTTLDKAEKVRVNKCTPSKTCVPSIEFMSDEKPLWYRDPGRQQSFPFKSQKRDTTSIWQVKGVHKEDYHNIDGRRNQIVSALVDKTGDPLPPGQIATTLANEVIITIPTK